MLCYESIARCCCRETHWRMFSMGNLFCSPPVLLPCASGFRRCCISASLQNQALFASGCCSLSLTIGSNHGSASGIEVASLGPVLWGSQVWARKGPTCCGQIQGPASSSRTSRGTSYCLFSSVYLLRAQKNCSQRIAQEETSSFEDHL